MIAPSFRVGMTMVATLAAAGLLAVGAGAAAGEDTGDKPWPITIQEIDPWEGELPSLEGLHDPLREISIEGGNFVRGGKFVFLTAEQQFFFPDVCRILGLDIVELREAGHLVRPNSVVIDAKDGKIDVTYRTPVHVERALREALSYGIIPQIELNEGRGDYAMATIEAHYPDAFMPVGITPYIGYNETNPIGYKLRHSYWQTVLNATVKYPMFSYEAFNEVPYANGGEHEQELFRKYLEQKFGTVEKMNAVLGCEYTALSDVHIRNRWTWRVWGREFPGVSESLFTEWCVFQSKRSGQTAKTWHDSLKAMSRHYPSHIMLQSPWLGGALGFDPREKMKGEDIFGAETYSAAFDGDLTPELVGLELMKGPQYLDVVRAACSDKPIFDCEGRVGKSNPMGAYTHLTSSKVVDLAGVWKFGDGTDIDGEEAGWYRPGFADADWAEIEVPGMWGHTDAYKNVQIGWYRRTFDLPEDAFRRYSRLYLAGKDLTDVADIYLNGEHLYRTRKWNELVQLDVTDALKPGVNSVAIRIENRYSRNGMYFGGIRKFIVITDHVKDMSFASTSPTQLKRFLWNEVAHGVSGKNLWHVQVLCRGIPDHGAIYSPALEALPFFKAELANVADIVMPRPRIRGRLAIYWPYETLLADKTSPYSVKGGRNALGSLDKYYATLLFSGIPLDFVDSRSLKDRGLDQYEMLFFVDSERLGPSVLPIVEAYVRAGGITVLNGGSLRTDHDWHRPLTGTAFLGVDQIAPVSEPYEIVFTEGLENASVKTQPAEGEPAGWRFNVTDAERTEVIARDMAGNPAIVATPHGKGRVYYVGATLDALTMNLLLNRILDSHLLARDFRVALEGKRNMYIESHVFRGQGKQVWLFTNWNGVAETFTATLGKVPDASVVIRNIANGDFVKSPDGDNEWTEDEAAAGLDLMVEPSGTLVLLVEDAGSELRQLEFLSPRHRKLVADLFDHNIGGRERALYMFESGMNFIRSPAVNALLRIRDYEIHDQLSYHPDYPVWDGKSKRLARLADYGMVIFVAPYAGGDIRDKKTFPHVEKDLLAYVAEGGNLLFCGRPSGFVFCRPGNYNFGDFDGKFNVDLAFAGLAGTEFFFDDPMYVVVKQFEDHVLTQGVKSFYCSALSSLRILEQANPVVTSVQPLMRTNFVAGDRQINDAVVAAAIEYGKGKIVVVNGCRWMESQEMKLGDNAHFFLNILSWFEGKAPEIMDKAKLAETVDLSLAPEKAADAGDAEGDASAAGEPETSKALFEENFEAYAPGAKEVASIDEILFGEVGEESFHPATGREGERTFRLAEFIPREKPNYKGFAYLRSTPFRASGKVKVSFWIKTKEALARVSLVPADAKEDDPGVVVYEGSTLPTRDLLEGWEFIEKEAALPAGASDVRLVVKIVSHAVNGFVYCDVDDLKVERA